MWKFWPPTANDSIAARASSTVLAAARSTNAASSFDGSSPVQRTLSASLPTCEPGMTRPWWGTRSNVTVCVTPVSRRISSSIFSIGTWAPSKRTVSGAPATPGVIVS